FESGDLSSKSFWDHLAKEVSENAGYHWNKVAASTAISTGITAPFFALMGGGNASMNQNQNVQDGTNGADNANNNELDFRTGDNAQNLQADNEELKAMQEELANINEELPKVTNPTIQQNLMIRRDNLQNAINNFGKDAETVRNEKLGENPAPMQNSEELGVRGEKLGENPAPVQDPKVQEKIQALQEERAKLQDTINKATVTPEYFADPQKQAEINSLMLRVSEIDEELKNSEELGAAAQNPNAKETPLFEERREAENAGDLRNIETPKTQETQSKSKPRNEEELRQSVKRKMILVGESEDLAEVASRVFIAGNKYFAKWTGEKLENLVDVDNLNFKYKNVIPDNNGNPTKTQGQTHFDELKTIITLSKYANKSTILHEFGHVFMKKFQALAQAGKLKGLAKQDFETLLRNYKIEVSEIGDFNSSSWVNGHEKLATDLERYFYTGEAPNAKLKRIFGQFKEWLRAIYNEIKDIKYIGADGQPHSFDLSPDVKKVFDNMFNNEELGVRSEKLGKAKDNRQLDFGNVETFDPKERNRENERIAEEKRNAAPTRIDVEEAPEIAQDTEDKSDSNNLSPTERNRAVVITPRGTKFEIRYRVVEAGDLVTSNNDDFSINKNYPQELQNRNRDNFANKEQVMDIASNLVPELVAENVLASNGAPIIDSNLVVEAGNGLTMGIRRAYNIGNQRSVDYKNWVINNATKFGLNSDYVAKMERPVLVRERISDIDTGKLISEANESSIAAMSATEQALEDSKKIDSDVLKKYDYSKSFDDNVRFIHNVIKKIGGKNIGELVRKDSTLSNKGIDRVQNALAAKAYKDVDIIENMSENPDDEIRTISQALRIAAPEVAMMQNEIDNGKIDKDYSIADDLMKAVKRYANLKKSNKTASQIRAWLLTLDMFDEDKISPVEKQIMLFFTDNYRSAKKIAKGLSKYALGAIRSKNEISFDPDAQTKQGIMGTAFAEVNG
ncbi:MAG: hypothetical protein IJ597_05750, partial [Synergistaceae bacterium]|nr:hypothetical protein [Synergistaceae bacterium]